ncbi:terminase small subunit [Alteromonas phage vB_AemP_PT15-A5]|nr:terminase small subunit [Alteromonas phage vB_AemP_PT15-A5]
MSTTLTVDLVKSATPANLRNNINQEFVNKLNTIDKDPLVAEQMRERALGFINILAEGKFRIDDYINAVKFVTYRMSGSTQQAAYCKTFPDRHLKFKADNLTNKEISAYTTMYAKGKLVSMLMERAMIPVWLVNADNFQKAINTQVEIMTDVNNSAMARTTAANSVMTHIKPPETAKLEITNNTEEQQSVLQELRKATQALTEQQRQSIENGTHTVKDIAHSDIVDADIIEE